MWDDAKNGSRYGKFDSLCCLIALFLGVLVATALGFFLARPATAWGSLLLAITTAEIFLISQFVTFYRDRRNRAIQTYEKLPPLARKSLQDIAPPDELYLPRDNDKDKDKGKEKKVDLSPDNLHHFLFLIKLHPVKLDLKEVANKIDGKDAAYQQEAKNLATMKEDNRPQNKLKYLKSEKEEIIQLINKALKLIREEEETPDPY